MSSPELWEKCGIPPLLRDFQAQWESPLFGLFHVAAFSIAHLPTNCAIEPKNQGALLPHAKLLRTIWGPEYGEELEYLRAYVRALRKKIEEDPAQPKYILTEPWVGYRFEPGS